jgi:hypothetical protein
MAQEKPSPTNEEPATEEYIIEQIVPTNQELYLLVNQLSHKWAKCYPGSIHSDLCREALKALTDELLRRRQARG